MTWSPLRRRHALDRERAASRITAYVYGTIIALAAVIPLTQENAESGLSFAIVLGASLTTYVAHVLAESVGLRVRAGASLTWHELRDELRDSTPVLTSGVIPAVILGLAWLTDVPGLWAHVAAEAYIVVRLALTGFAIERLAGRRPSLRTFLVGIALAAVGVAVSVLKIALGAH